jgi:large subunit ribosomal protein L4
MPKKMRRAALRSALSVKASEGEIVMVDVFELEEAKTRNMAEVFKALAGDATVLLVLPENSSDYEDVKRSCANLANVKTLLASYLNIRDLLGYKNVVMPVASLDVISSYLG